MTVALGLDIGGTKLAAGLVDAGGGVRAGRRRPTPPGADPETLFDALTGLAEETLAEAGPGALAGVGVGCGGPMRWPSGVVSPLNIPGWRSFPLRDRLARRWPGLPVRLHNDAVCFAIAEHWRGAGTEVDDLLGVVVSTGVGGGLVLGNRVVDGGTGNAGHVGHLVVAPGGPVCTCGARGCLEAVSRGGAVVAYAEQCGWRRGGAGAGATATARDVADSAAAGDPVAQAAFRRAGEGLGTALAAVVHLCDIRRVVVGGGLAQAGDLLLAPAREALMIHATLPYAAGVQIVPAAAGGWAGVIGAGALVMQPERYWSAD